MCSRRLTAARSQGAVAGPRRAQPSQAVHLPIDSAGKLYVADQGNSSIRKITPSGTTTTVAGTAGTSGVLLGAAPRFALPQSLAIVGDSIVISDVNTVLLLRRGAR